MKALGVGRLTPGCENKISLGTFTRWLLLMDSQGQAAIQALEACFQLEFQQPNAPHYKLTILHQPGLTAEKAAGILDSSLNPDGIIFAIGKSSDI